MLGHEVHVRLECGGASLWCGGERRQGLEYGVGEVWGECIRWQEAVGEVRVLCLCYMTCRGYEGDKAVLQVKYVTDNPAAPAVFYQCADVGIAK